MPGKPSRGRTPIFEARFIGATVILRRTTCFIESESRWSAILDIATFANLIRKIQRDHKQRFYNPNILGIFDEHYTRVAGGPSERTSFKALGASGQHGPWRAGVQEMARGPVRRRAMLSSGCPR